MDGEIHRVIPPDVQPAQGVIDGQRQVNHGPATDRSVGRKQHVPDRPEMPNAPVICNPNEVIKDKGATKLLQ